jgi:hypothetical protein
LPPPTSPQRQFKLLDVGLDRRSDATAVQRTVAFVVDGPSLVTAELSNVSGGRVRMCLGRNAIDPQNDCQTMRNGSISRAVFDAGESDWRVTLIGVSDGSPFVTLTLSFNADFANVHLDSFRFNGTTDAHYNGFIARLDAVNSDNMNLQASFDDGHDNPYQYHAVITRTSNDEVLLDQTGGPQGSVSISQPLTAGEGYRVELSEPEEFAGGGQFAVFVDATLTWP